MLDCVRRAHIDLRSHPIRRFARRETWAAHFDTRRRLAPMGAITADDQSEIYAP